MVTGFEHVHMMFANLEEARKYFVNILGGREVARGEIRGMPVIRVNVAGIVFILHTADAQAPQFETGKGIRGLDHVGFLVKDIEKTVAEMKQKGAHFSQEVKTTGDGVKFTYVDGPEGIRFELMEK